MRRNLPVTGREVDFAGEIISATDLKEKITHANPQFVKTSGFSEAELLGQPHNLIRHRDMPAKSFKSLWDAIRAGKPWMGVAKNRCKNGDHYWVDAFITPVFQNGQVTGYESVRVPPKARWKQRVEQLCAKIRAGKFKRC